MGPTKSDKDRSCPQRLVGKVVGRRFPAVADLSVELFQRLGYGWRAGGLRQDSKYAA